MSLVSPIMVQGVNQTLQEVTGIKSHEDAKPAIDQAGLQNIEAKKTDLKQTQVVAKDQPTFGQQKHDAKEKGRNEYVDIRIHNKEVKVSGPVKDNSPLGHGFDIKI